jgi:nucleoside-diphosphate-sugar epimerase
MEAPFENLIVTGSGFLGSHLRKHFELTYGDSFRAWTAGRSGSSNSLTAIVEDNELTNFAVILSGWSGVAASLSRNQGVQTQSLIDFEKQVEEVTTLRPLVTLGFGSQIEKSALKGSKLEDITDYARAKMRAREIFEASIEQSSLVGKWIYIFSVYGEGMDSGWILPKLIDAHKNGALVSMGACLQRWGFLHVSDFCRAIDLILSRPSDFPFTIDIGDEAARSLRDLVHEVEKILGSQCATFSNSATLVPDSIPDLRPLKSAGWSQHVTLEQGLEELKDSYARND